MSFRKEKKIRVTSEEFHKFKNLLFQQGMTKLYEPRKVNSIYFDTINLDMFIDSEEGALPRKKLRVRWYNYEKKFMFENKLSSIEGRYKTTKLLEEISKDQDILGKQYFDSQYGKVFPSLRISYERSYFSFRSMRITFDHNITYRSRKSAFKNFYQDPERVIEIKIPFGCPDDYVERQIPYSTSRFSKYSRGMLLSSGELSRF